nr:methyltransferase domain-containing protein [Micromonospora sp. DSM 115978]
MTTPTPPPTRSDEPASPVGRPDPATYLHRVAASESGRAYKLRLLRHLRPAPGQTILDLGCGPGTDLLALATTVGPHGTVLGVDHDPTMLTHARHHLTALTANPPPDRQHPRTTQPQPAAIRLCAGDAHALPLADASVDAARADRVLMHLADPARAIAELRRVLRPGGRLTLAEPDWHTLVVDDTDLHTSHAYTRYITDQIIRNAAIGRQLGRLATHAGLTVTTHDATAVVFTDHPSAEPILRLREVTARAVHAGAIDPDAAARWLHRITGTVPFLAAVTLFTLTATRPHPA